MICCLSKKSGGSYYENNQSGSQYPSRQNGVPSQERTFYTGMLKQQTRYSDVPMNDTIYNKSRSQDPYIQNQENIGTNAQIIENPYIVQKPFIETRPPRHVPSIIESGPPPPPANIYSKDGAYPCPYVQCYARRIQDKEVTIQTDCWERVLVSTWRRVKRPCKVRIPQYEPVCKTYGGKSCNPIPTEQRLQNTTYSAPKSFDRNNDMVLDAAEREQARAARKLLVESRNSTNPRQASQYNVVPQRPTPAKLVKTTYEAPRRYDLNNDGVLDSKERALAARDGKLKVVKQEVVADPRQAPAESTSSHGTYFSPNVTNGNILEVAEREHDRKYGHQLPDG